MISLRQALARRAATEPLWRNGAAWKSVHDVLTAVSDLSGAFSSGPIALACANDESFALGMLAAEGRCESVLLIPASWDQALFDRYRLLAGVELLVTDRADLRAPQKLRLGACFERAVPPASAGAIETRWIIPTSGTTGQPKLVEHRLATLARTVRTDSAKGRELNWGLVYELARFAGLQVFLQAMLGGSRLVFVRREAGIETLLGDLAAAGCNALSATPTFWRRMLMAPAAGELPLQLVTLGGEIADQAVLTSLRVQYPAAKVVHIYASTEAGVGFSVGDGRAGFPANYLQHPPSGTQLKVEIDGMLWVRPALGGQRYLGGADSLVAADGWINTGDQVHRVGDRMLFLGRANGAINVGGNKVFPEEVEDCIRGVSGVRHVGVRARSNPLVGSLVEALVLPENGADRAVLKSAIVQSCRGALAPYKVPALVTWVDEVAMTAAGKSMRS
jgi:acyl-CoA synthetase (AMP-forming)/AMP-acid ligase II